MGITARTFLLFCLLFSLQAVARVDLKPLERNLINEHEKLVKINAQLRALSKKERPKQSEMDQIFREKKSVRESFWLQLKKLEKISGAKVLVRNGRVNYLTKAKYQEAVQSKIEGIKKSLNDRRKEEESQVQKMKFNGQNSSQTVGQ
ncbi:MAG: hypothetical protein HN509_14535 [Halobacteriovoraceae bacterium]|nr:hypothetical protein [Halobacteriovoraceae bacterium]MBT5094793.1 hypothetical protein [Halobacteriovoraceae bacterium]